VNQSKEIRDILLAEYSAILNSYIDHRDEASLELGYNFGRKIVDSKLGLLAVLEIHTKSLVNRLRSTSKEDSAATTTVIMASEILSATLASFEMIHRGYEEMIQKLQSLNEELHRQAEELTQANKEIESFSYSVSHDLRAPLRTILSFSEAVLEDLGGNASPEVLKSSQRVIAAAKRMDTLITDILNLSKLNRKTLERREVDLSAMVTEIMLELQSTQHERSSTIVIQPGLIVTGDPDLLRVAMTNLLSNAWKFTAKTSAPRIEFGRLNQNNETVYFVKDNGAGFAMEYAERLFGAFQRLHSEKDFEGTGIGLATVQRVIHRHGGRIWAEAKENHGATFFFTLE